MGHQNGTGGVDLSGPLAGMWRDVYRKAAGVAEARTQELLKYHVYTYPHGAGGGGGGGNWVLIEDRVVAADYDPLSFTGLPQTYRDLRLVLEGRAVGEAYPSSRVSMQVNGDGAVDRYRSRIHYAYQGAHASESPDGGAAQAAYFAQVGNVPAELSTDPASTGIVDLLLYHYAQDGAPKRFTSLVTLTGEDTYGVQTRHGSGEWRGTAAISRIDLFTQSGSPRWEAGTRCRVYGWQDAAAGGGDGAEVTISTDASLTSVESPVNTFALAARLSADAGNALALRANGLYATDTGGGGGTGNTTMYTQTGTPTGATNSLWFNPSESA